MIGVEIRKIRLAERLDKGGHRSLGMFEKDLGLQRWRRKEL